MRVLIVHGINGNSEENWFSWLKDELETLGAEVHVPDFPNSSHPNLEEWMKYLKPEHLDENTIVVGHSLGVAFILRMLEHIKFKSAIFVAGFIDLPGNQYDLKMKSFFKTKFDWENIRRNCGRFVVVGSYNDPYLEATEYIKICNQLDVVPNIIEDGGHFNTASGFDTFPELLDIVKKQIEME